MQVEMRLNLTQVKRTFLYDKQGNPIRHGLDKARHSRLSKAGAFVRTNSRRKVGRKAAQKTISELSRDERVRYHVGLALHNGRPVNRATWSQMDGTEKAAFHWERRQIVRGKRRRRNKPKRPLRAARRGEAPRRRIGLLKQHLYFGFDARTRSVVVGPADLPSKRDEQPRVLEEGGTVTLQHGPRKGKRMPIHSHPYMAPALREEMGKVPELFRDSI